MRYCKRRMKLFYTLIFTADNQHQQFFDKKMTIIDIPDKL